MRYTADYSWVIVSLMLIVMNEMRGIGNTLFSGAGVVKLYGGQGLHAAQ